MAKKYYLETLNPQVNILVAEAILAKGLEPSNCQKLIKFKNHHLYTWEIDKQIIQNLTHSEFKFGCDWLLYCEQEEEFHICCPKFYSPAEEANSSQPLNSSFFYSLANEKIKNVIRNFKARIFVGQENKTALVAQKNILADIYQLIADFCRLTKKLNQEQGELAEFAPGPNKEEKLESLKLKWRQINASLAGKKNEILVDDTDFIFSTLACLREYAEIRLKLEKMIIKEILRAWIIIDRKPKYAEIIALGQDGVIINIRYFLAYQNFFDGSYRRLISVAEQIKEQLEKNGKEERIAQWAQSPEGQRELKEALGKAKKAAKKFKKAKQLTFADWDNPITI